MALFNVISVLKNTTFKGVYTLNYKKIIRNFCLSAVISCMYTYRKIITIMSTKCFPTIHIHTV